MSKDVLKPEKLSGLKTYLVILAAAGVVTFGIGVLADPEHTWKIFLVNFLFWSGISVAGPIFSAIFELTNARWASRKLREIAESFAGFLPLSLCFYFVMMWGGSTYLYSWIVDLPTTRAGWFSLNFFVIRDGMAWIILIVVIGKFILASRQFRARPLPNSGHLTALSISTILVYVFVLSLLAIDLIMSIDPHWLSTLFPAYFFMGNLYAGLSMIVILSGLSCYPTGAKAWFTTSIAHDLGKLMLGFCLLWVYLMWSQFLVIWYGNLPEELSFVLERTDEHWSSLAWLELSLCFIIPFVFLLTRHMKKPKLLPFVAIAALLGMSLERFLLVMPFHKSPPKFVLMDLGISVGFLALFLLSQDYCNTWLDKRDARSSS
ncbi:MAG: hypothetical protein VYA53_07360 [Acidobacteriota bacterium]|nr:hypothetical protein [Acidobacteriota bacterium]